MKIKPTHKIKLDNPGEYFAKVSRGVGSPQPKKGKGSYRRKDKHRKKDWE